MPEYPIFYVSCIRSQITVVAVLLIVDFPLSRMPLWLSPARFRLTTERAIVAVLLYMYIYRSTVRCRLFC